MEVLYHGIKTRYPYDVDEFENAVFNALFRMLLFTFRKRKERGPREKLKIERELNKKGLRPSHMNKMKQNSAGAKKSRNVLSRNVLTANVLTANVLTARNTSVRNVNVRRMSVLKVNANVLKPRRMKGLGTRNQRLTIFMAMLKIMNQVSLLLLR